MNRQQLQKALEIEKAWNAYSPRYSQADKANEENLMWADRWRQPLGPRINAIFHNRAEIEICFLTNLLNSTKGA